MSASFSRRDTLDRKVVEPNRIAAERRNEFQMGVAILGSYAEKQRVWPCPDEHPNVSRRRPDRIKLQRCLARRDQLDIDRGQQLGVEQRAVLRAAGTIDPITGT